MLNIIQQAQKHSDRTAVISGNQSYTFQELLSASSDFAHILLRGSTDINETRVAFMVSPGFDYLRVQWGIWQAGGIIVPLCLTYPLPSLRYTIENSDATILVVSPEYADLLSPLAIEKELRFIVLETDDLAQNTVTPKRDEAESIKGYFLIL